MRTLIERSAILYTVLLLITTGIINIPLVYGISNISSNNNILSLNWAGYIASHSNYGFASGTWIVPQILPQNTGRVISVSAFNGLYSSTWVGVGGGSGGSTVVQTGTEQDCLPPGVPSPPHFAAASISGLFTAGPNQGPQLHSSSSFSSSSPASSSAVASPVCVPNYFAWWETFPANAERPIQSITVSPGDRMSASVDETSPGIWTLSITDFGTPVVPKSESFSINVNFPSADKTTAEAIQERPAVCVQAICQITRLADFGQTSFLQSSAGSSLQTSSSLNSLPNTSPVTMVDTPDFTLASPGLLTPSGGFSVGWVNSGHLEPFNIHGPPRIPFGVGALS